jgi:pyroglutamyl-peptidase
MKTRIDAAARCFRSRFAGGIFLVSLFFFLLPAFYSSALTFSRFDAAAAQAESPSLGRFAAKESVILLTGFEPFGKRRLPNSSWEGVKELDGLHWKGYKLVCKQLPVVWGAPLAQLPGWISQYEPVAIFSFGQGGQGSYALESKASNERSRKSADNLGKKPAVTTIVADGPKVFQASADCQAMAHLLASKGYPTRVSTAAGRYLCEENLYSLEYLKSTKQLDATVLFCHVPPLDSEIGKALLILSSSTVGFGQSPLLAASSVVGGKTLRGQPVAAANVKDFVMDTLETWHTIYQGTAAQGQPKKAKTEDAREREVKELIVRYFRTWSEQDMKGYDACFLPDAVIQFIDETGGLSSYGRRQFIANQSEYHRKATVKAIEVPESIDIRFEAKLARVVVFWRLTAGLRNETGYDHFTLLKHDGNWRIVNLTFYPAAKKIPD